MLVPGPGTVGMLFPSCQSSPVRNKWDTIVLSNADAEVLCLRPLQVQCRCQNSKSAEPVLGFVTIGLDWLIRLEGGSQSGRETLELLDSHNHR